MAMPDAGMSRAVDPGPRSRSLPPYRRYWLALLHRNVEQADQIVRQSLRLWRPAQIYLRLFAPALNLSGIEWQRGTISYRDEHFITWNTLRFMRSVRRDWVVHEPTGPLALAAGVAQESHRIGLRMVCDFLQAANWQIRWHWQTERGMLRDAIATHQPRLLLFTVGMREGIEPLGRLIADARRRGFDGLVVVGGRTIAAEPSLVQTLGADLTARDGLDLLRRIRRIG